MAEGNQVSPLGRAHGERGAHIGRCMLGADAEAQGVDDVRRVPRPVCVDRLLDAATQRECGICAAVDRDTVAWKTDTLPGCQHPVIEAAVLQREETGTVSEVSARAGRQRGDRSGMTGMCRAEATERQGGRECERGEDVRPHRAVTPSGVRSMRTSSTCNMVDALPSVRSMATKSNPGSGPTMPSTRKSRSTQSQPTVRVVEASSRTLSGSPCFATPRLTATSAGKAPEPRARSLTVYVCSGSAGATEPKGRATDDNADAPLPGKASTRES